MVTPDAKVVSAKRDHCAISCVKSASDSGALMFVECQLSQISLIAPMCREPLPTKAGIRSWTELRRRASTGTPGLRPGTGNRGREVYVE